MLTTMGVHPRLWVTVPPRCIEQERDGGYPPRSSRHAEICDRRVLASFWVGMGVHYANWSVQPVDDDDGGGSGQRARCGGFQVVMATCHLFLQ